MEASDELWTKAHAQAEGHLRRHCDGWTRSHRDDLVQEATLAAWQWARQPHDQRRFWAAIRTITRRVRGRALWTSRRMRIVLTALAHAGGDGDHGEVHLEIAGRRVPVHEVTPLLQRALQRLPALDRQLLLGFHEGFCCAELAARTRRSEPCVKTRIHRARRRVQCDIEEHVRAADGLDA